MTKNNKIAAGLAAIMILLALIIYQNRKPGDSPAGESSQKENSTNNTSTSLESLVGKPAPSFSFTSLDGKIYSSENLRGKNVVLFFNEGLMCYPACWNQIAALGTDTRFKSEDLIGLSVVVDQKDGWKKAVEQMPELSQAIVVFDDGGEISRKFNVLKTSSSMHYGYLPGHTYVVLDKEGIIRYVLDDPSMATRNNQIFAEVSKLNR